MIKQRIKSLFVNVLLMVLIISSIPLKGFAEEIVADTSNTSDDSVRIIPTEDAYAKNLKTDTAETIPVNGVDKSNSQSNTIDTPDLVPGEIVDERTANTKTFYNGNGKYTEKVYFEPVHMKESGEKNYEEISPKLVPDETKINVVTTENTPIDTEFLKKMSDGKYVNFTYKGHSMSLSVLQAAGENKTTLDATDVDAHFVENSNKIVHEGIFPQIDLQNLTFNQNTKEDLVLHKYDGYHIFKFKIQTDLNAVIDDLGNIQLKDENGNKILELPRPYMSDSNIDEGSGEAKSSDKIKYELERTSGGYYLTINADSEWLASPERVFPIYIDPSASATTTDDSFVMSAYPTTNYSSTSAKYDNGLQENILKVGTVDSTTGTCYGYLSQPLPDNLYGLTITSATLNAYVTYSYSHATATGIWLDRITEPWLNSTVTWNTRPSSVNIASDTVAENQWATFDITSTVQEWLKGTYPYYGFKLHENGNGQTYWKKVISTDNGTSKPYIAVNYTIPTPTIKSSKAWTYGDGTGYVDLDWDPLPYAKSYSVWIYNGTAYEEFPVGTATSFSTRNKNIWPKNSAIDTGRRLLYHPPETGGQELGDPSYLYLKSGGAYATHHHFWFRITATFERGTSSLSTEKVPTIPNLPIPPAPKGNVYSNDFGGSYGNAVLKWDKIAGATGYKIWLFNGSKYEVVGDVKSTSNTEETWSSKGKAIWPSDSEIANADSSKSVFHFDPNNPDNPSGNGTELPKDPSKLYAKMGTTYATSKNFYFRISAYNNDGETLYSNSYFSQSMPNEVNPSEERLGLEDYWTYGSHTLGDGQGSVNVTNGNLVAIFGDASIYTRGVLGYRFDRTYNSESTKLSPIGKGWTFAGNESLQEVNDPNNQLTKVIYYDEDGTYHEFLYNSNTSQFTSPKGKYLTLSKITINGKRGYEILDKTGLKKQFEVITPDNGKFRLNNYKDKFNNSIGFFYDTSNRLIKISELDSSGNPIRKSIDLTYSGASTLINTAQYVDRVFTYSYNTDQTLASVKLSDSKNPSNYFIDGFSYDSLGRMSSFKDYQYKFDMLSTQYNETKFDYSTQKKLVVNENVDGVNVNTTYDFTNADSYKVTDKDSNVTTYTRDKDTFAIAIIDKDEVTENSYDANYNILTTTVGDQVTKYTYDANGNQKTMEDPEKNQTINDYDLSTNNLKSTIEKDSTGATTSTTNYSYDPSSKWVLSISNSDGITSFDVDQFGRNKKITNPDNTFVTTSYDDSTNTKTVIDQFNHKIDTSFNDYGDVISITDPDNNVTKYDYEPLKPSQLNSVTQPRGDVTKYYYDQNGNFSKITDGLGRDKIFVFDNTNNITSYTTPVSLAEQKYMNTTFEYNNDGKITKKIYNSKIEKRYVYDPVTQNLTNIDFFKDNVRQGGWSYLYENDLLKSINFGTLSKGYTYTVNNDLESYTQGNFKQTNLYDINKVLSDIKTSYSDQTTSFSKKESIQFDENDEKKHVDIKAEDDSIQVSVDTAYDSVTKKQTVNLNNDKFKRITQFNNEEKIDNITFGSPNFTYLYYTGGNIKEEHYNDKITSFIYDKNQQLKQEDLPDGTRITYEYDNAGNRTKREVSKAGNVISTDLFVPNDANQVKTKNGYQYSYDLDGNLLSDENYTYTYNYLGQLTNVLTKSGVNIASYEYDEENQRTKKIIGNKVIEYYYKDSNLALEVIKVDGVITGYRYYIFNNDNYPIGVIWKQKNDNQAWSENIYYFVTNQRGDVISIVDNNGQEVASYSYDSFGNVLSSSGLIASENPIRYAGYYYDQETKHYYLMARYYNPSNGNFQSFDPILPNNDPNPISQNGYTYAENNPLNVIDPSGQSSNATTKTKKVVPYPTFKQMYLLADDAYTKYEVDKWVNGWTEVSLSRYEYKSFFGFNARVYTKPQNNGKFDFVISYRGSEELSDWATDAYEIGGGRKGPQVNQAIALAKNIIKKNPKSINKIYFTGHSLGGYLASFVESEIVDGDLHVSVPHSSYTFNAPGVAIKSPDSGNYETYNKVQKDNKGGYNRYITNYRILGDPISALNHKLGKLYELKSKKSYFNPFNYHKRQALRDTLNVYPRN